MAGSPLSTDEGHLDHGFLVPASPGFHLPGGLPTTPKAPMGSEAPGCLLPTDAEGAS